MLDARQNTYTYVKRPVAENMELIQGAFHLLQQDVLMDPLLAVFEHEDTVANAKTQPRVDEDVIVVDLTSPLPHVQWPDWIHRATPELDYSALVSDCKEPSILDMHPDFRFEDELCESPEINARPISSPVAVEKPMLNDEVTVIPVTKPVAAVVHRVAPEGFDIGPATLEETDAQLNAIKTPMLRETFTASALIDWLGTINTLSHDEVSREITSGAGGKMMALLRESLWYNYGDETQGVRKEVADELEALGYQVSFNKNNRIMLVELQSAALRWMVR